MRDPITHGIGEQNTAYRRGLVLGLTMAEVGILIIFVLLLLLAFGEWKREQALAARRDQVSVSKSRLQSLEASTQLLQQLAEASGAGPNTPPDEIKRLIEAVKAVASTPEGGSMLADAKAELEKIRTVRQSLEKLADPSSKSLPAQLQEQGFELANKEGQLKRYEKQLLEAGLGKGERPCWVRPDGTIEYLYDVVLVSGGIRMREYVHPHRVDERVRYRMPVINPEEILSAGEFLTRTEPLYNESLAANCRFFVVVYDGTEPTEKELYKRLLRTVEGHFYKRLDRGPSPF